MSLQSTPMPTAMSLQSTPMPTVINCPPYSLPLQCTPIHSNADCNRGCVS